MRVLTTLLVIRDIMLFSRRPLEAGMGAWPVTVGGGEGRGLLGEEGEEVEFRENACSRSCSCGQKWD